MEQFKKLFQATDMTVGTPWKKIVAFTIPMLLGNIAQQLYNTVDSIVVGKYVGDNALAAVGSAGPIMNLLLVLFIGISMGASIMVTVFWCKTKRRSLLYYWKLYFTDSNFQHIYYVFGAGCCTSAIGTFANSVHHH